MHDFLNFLLGLVILGAMATVTIAIMYYYDRREPGIRMTLRSIKKVYKINPMRWTFCDYCAYFDTGHGLKTITFNIIEFYKYKLWQYMKWRKEAKFCGEQDKQEILSIIKADAEKVKGK